MEDTHYVGRPDDVELISGAPEAIRCFNRIGLPVVLVSNQSGVGRGLLTDQQHHAVHARFLELLDKHGCRLHASYYCTHHPEDGCGCRKPNPGMLVKAAAELDIDLERSFVIGDKLSDVEAGRRAGCRTGLVLTGYGTFSALRAPATNVLPDRVGPNLLALARWIVDGANELCLQCNSGST